jgi:penicillin-binding protein 2
VSEGNRTRIAVVGAVVLALFGALLTRLWFLTVAGHETYVAQARQNGVRVAFTQPERGIIWDRDGKPLVRNTTTFRATISRGVTDTERHQALVRLSDVIGVPKSELERRLNSADNSPLLPAPVWDDVPADAVTYIAEHAEEFPGVEVAPATTRVYPYGSAAAHVLGYIGSMNDTEYEAHGAGDEPDYQLGDDIGKDGVESYYDAELRGSHGVQSLRVDAAGRVLETLGSQPAVPGNNLELTIDLALQRAAEQYLADGLARQRQQPVLDRTTDEPLGHNFLAPAGAVVVMKVDTGEIVAMASNPTYEPEEFIGGIPADVYEQLNDKATFFPLLNRATQGQYAPGSTFKPVTAFAAWESGVLPYPWYEITDEDGFRKFGLRNQQTTYKNFESIPGGQVNLVKALQISNDVYFYDMAWGIVLLPKDLNDTVAQDDMAIQQTARRFGFDQPTGIDLAGERRGRVPDREWLERINKESPEFFPYNIWLGGYTISMSVGQGDLLATPLQMATAYAAIGNGGYKVTPHVVGRIVSPLNTVVREIAPPPVDIGLDPEIRKIVMLGLSDAVMTEEGTAFDAFEGFDFGRLPIAGKTGTAETCTACEPQNTAVFSALVPANDPEYVITVFIEKGDTGGSTAAPIAREIIEYMYCTGGAAAIRQPDPLGLDQQATIGCPPLVAVPAAAPPGSDIPAIEEINPAPTNAAVIPVDGSTPVPGLPPAAPSTPTTTAGATTDPAARPGRSRRRLAARRRFDGPPHPSGQGARALARLPSPPARASSP